MKVPNSFEDDRGIIRDLVAGEQVDAVTLITSVVGAVRANHFHKHTTQWTYVIAGRIEYACAQVSESPIGDLKLTRRDSMLLGEGEMVESRPWEAHAIRALEDAQLLIITRGPRSGDSYEDDTFRLSKDQCLI